MSLDELIQHVEVDDRYDEWRGTGTEQKKEGFAIDIGAYRKPHYTEELCSNKFLCPYNHIDAM